MRLALALLLALIQSIAFAGTLAGSVVRVTDGDTIVVLGTDDVQHKIRLQA